MASREVCEAMERQGYSAQYACPGCKRELELLFAQMEVLAERKGDGDVRLVSPRSAR